MMLVTYASADGYLDELPNLLRGWRGEVWCEVMPPEMSWVDVCNYKPRLIQRACRAYAGFVIYLDADAIIQTPFTADDVRGALGGNTFGVRHLDGALDSVCSGTIFVDSTHRDLQEWLRRWMELIAARPNRRLCDQANLSDMCKEWPHASLDPAWCWMEPTTPAKVVPPPDPVYIWHMQKSRAYAKAKGGKGSD